MMPPPSSAMSRWSSGSRRARPGMWDTRLDLRPGVMNHTRALVTTYIRCAIYAPWQSRMCWRVAPDHEGRRRI